MCILMQTHCTHQIFFIKNCIIYINNVIKDKLYVCICECACKRVCAYV